MNASSPNLLPDNAAVTVREPRGLPAPPGFLAGMAMAMRLAWRQLWSEKARLASAMAGVMFACVLVFMQLGFHAALFESATALIGSMRADAFLMHPLTTASFRSEVLPRSRASQAFGVPEVQAAVPVYLAQTSLRNPVDGSRRAIQLIGFDMEAGAMDFPGLAPLVDTLKRPDTFAFDSRSRPEFGPIAALLARHGSLPVQLGNRQMEAVGTVEIGSSFGADGNAVMSELNFRRVVQERQASRVDLVAIRLKDGADPVAARDALRKIMPGDVVVMSPAELLAHERRYWEEATPIGFIFAFGSLMGLIVGMVIVYQILFSDIAGHLKEYATLKAMGYSNGYLARVVLGAAAILAFLGFVPGFVVSHLLYGVVGESTFLPLGMTPERGAMVFAAIFTMCALAGLLAMRKLREANPADMF
jgi:putative ABC transport system permease protein